MKSMRRISNRGNSGFTLVELLVTIAIMLLATMIVAAGVPAAHRAYVAAVDSSNAQLLLSTTTERLRDELSVAKSGIDCPDDYGASEASFSATYGEGTNALTVSVTPYVSFVSYETNRKTVIGNTEAYGICIVEEVSSEWRAMPLVSVTSAQGASASLRTQFEHGQSDASKPRIEFIDGVFTIHSLAVLNNGGKVDNASVDDLKIRVVSTSASTASSS